MSDEPAPSPAPGPAPRPWFPDPDALRGRVAVVADATRGAGRGIAAGLGEAGATVSWPPTGRRRSR